MPLLAGLSAAAVLLPAVTPQPASADPPALLVSATPDRLARHGLAGQTLGGEQYVFAAVPTGTRRVAFYVDGHDQPRRTDYTAAFDLVGSTNDGSARPFDVASLGPGSHTITAAVLAADRRLTTVSASFSVSAAVPADFAPGQGRPFRADSAWNQAIPADPALDQNSATWAAELSAGGAQQSVLLEETGVPVFDADASTPRYSVPCTKRWGPCPLAGAAVPVPDNAVPSASSDGAMVVIDWSARRSYEFWQARRTAAGGWETSWGSVNDIDGDGYDATANSPTGAGISRLAGVVRTYEVAQGRIDHALVFAASISAPGSYRYPAAKTDGSNMRGAPVPLPEGARIQLDPSLDVDAIPGITPGEKTVAKALQTYGAYNIDNGGYSTVGFNFETPVDEANPYYAAGFGWDYNGMPHIPWDRLRVLRTWDGS